MEEILPYLDLKFDSSDFKGVDEKDFNEKDYLLPEVANYIY